MVKYCKNCGEKLPEYSRYCKNCGHAVTHTMSCPKCRCEIRESDEYCPECGYTVKKSFLAKHKLFIPVIIIIAVVIVLIALTVMSPAEESVEPQVIEVGSVEFEIPGDYRIDPTGIGSEEKYSSEIFTKVWAKANGDSIYISTITVHEDISDDEMVKANGGVEKTIMNEHGYYSENDGIYTFSFKTNDKVCLVGVTDPSVFDEISYLEQ